MITAALAAGLVAVVVAWVSTTTKATGDAATFWGGLAGGFALDEIDPPENLMEAVERADAIVVAHVTGVKEGRQNKAPAESLPADSTRERYIYVQLTVDRVVRVTTASVKVGDVINLELPPIPIELARRHQSSGRQLFFLGQRADAMARSGFSDKITPEDYITYGPVSYRAVLADGPGRLIAPLELDDVAAFLATFNANSVEEAADRAEQASR